MATAAPWMFIWLLLAPVRASRAMDGLPKLYCEPGVQKEVKKSYKQGYKQGYEKAMQESAQIVESLDGQVRAQLELNKILVQKVQAAESKARETQQKSVSLQEQIQLLMAAPHNKQLFTSLQDLLKVLQDSSGQ